MSSNTAPTLRERIERVQKLLKLTAGQMAAELRITPEWLSKITNGRVQGSDDIGLRLDEFLRRKGIELSSKADAEPGSILRTPHHGGAGKAAQEIRDELETLLRQADSDPDRLGWIREQFRAHLAPPRHWQTGEVNQRARQIADRLNSEAEAARAPAPPREHKRATA